MSERGPEPTLVECANCRRQVPDGSFCGHCGASLSAATALSRRHAYAASPAESVYHVGLATTLFPHLTRGRGALFAWCLLAGVGVTVASARAVPPAARPAALERKLRRVETTGAVMLLLESA